MAENDVATTRRQDVARESSRTAPAERDRVFLQPAVDILEDAQGITLYADLPGVNVAGLDVHV
ncbi:MAG TPA: hypothetical protein VFP48_02305, partial [Steroidobacteraceae bacterium]|nr:hypothetical protein [Steroidobacteraceae bacterium]